MVVPLFHASGSEGEVVAIINHNAGFLPTHLALCLGDVFTLISLSH